MKPVFVLGPRGKRTARGCSEGGGERETRARGYFACDATQSCEVGAPIRYRGIGGAGDRLMPLHEPDYRGGGSEGLPRAHPRNLVVQRRYVRFDCTG